MHMYLRLCLLDLFVTYIYTYIHYIQICTYAYTYTHTHYIHTRDNVAKRAQNMDKHIVDIHSR